MIGPIRETSIDEARRAFSWPRPKILNIASVCCSDWAARAPEQCALLHIDAQDRIERWSFARLDKAANQFANMLIAFGLEAGDRIAVLLPQSPAALVAHLGAYKRGAVVVPLFAPFGAEAIQFRIEDADIRLLVTDAEGAAKTEAMRERSMRVLCIDGAAAHAEDFWAALARARDAVTATPLPADAPAFLSYTSGTTGAPKGALHAHRVVIGHLPAIQCWTMGLGAADRAAPAQAVVWTPADWAWLGGLCNLLLPALYYGATVVSAPMRPFDPERAAAIIDRLGVTHAFLPPTGLRLMRAADLRRTPTMRLMAIGAAGEAVGDAVALWAREALGAPVNEFYGQTELNGVIGWSAQFGEKPMGALGRALPGFDIAVQTDDGAIHRNDAVGELLIKTGAPSQMLGYWNNQAATNEKMIADYWLTGDRVAIDHTGVVRFAGRVDDVINSAGYRIGPAEIEDCLATHPAVAQAGVVGAPDALRGEAVAAFVVLKPSWRNAVEDDLREDLKRHAKVALGAYAAPRHIKFADQLPVTDTGKIIRRELRAILRRDAVL